ncbi:MAG: DUF433 domain-containing protein [Spirulina sp.]
MVGLDIGVETQTPKREFDFYHTPVYPVADAARYLRIPAPTLRSWLQGRSYRTPQGLKKASSPLIERPDANLPYLSFTNLVEAHVLRIIRETHQIRLDKVRQALDYMAQQLKTDHPLVMKQFQTDGVDLFVEQMAENQENALVNISRGGQFAMREVLNQLLTRIEWNAEGIASRFFPITDIFADAKSDRTIVIDPSIRFGKPMISGKGIPTNAIVNLYNAGDSVNDIAEEFGCTSEQIREAIRFESLLLAA